MKKLYGPLIEVEKKLHEWESGRGSKGWDIALLCLATLTVVIWVFAGWYYA
jgi:hypothetical protein